MPTPAAPVRKTLPPEKTYSDAAFWSALRLDGSATMLSLEEDGSADATNDDLAGWLDFGAVAKLVRSMTSVLPFLTAAEIL